jgi:hypothetical protein
MALTRGNSLRRVPLALRNRKARASGDGANAPTKIIGRSDFD